MSKWILKIRIPAAIGLTTIFLVTVAWTLSHRGLPRNYEELLRLPVMEPDYSDIVIPPNIAPLNFKLEESGTAYRVRIYGDQGEEIVIASRDAGIIIPPKSWKKLLQENRGGTIRIDAYVKSKKGAWRRYRSVENRVAEERIDSHLVYRLLGALCNQYERVGIYQRNLETYEESIVINNDQMGGGCVNCHSFRNNDPNLFSFHARPSAKNAPHIPAAMILVRDGHAEQLKTRSDVAPGPPGYISWRADGKAVAFALGKPRQIFRSCGAEIRDVFDLKSDLAIADTTTGKSSTSPNISNPELLETFPCWSADGKTLYYNSAASQWDEGKSMTPDDIKRTQFDLMRIAYDIDSNTWGEPEILLSAKETGKSIVEPRTSPDGNYLIFCMADYGGFPINQESSDLYLMDLESGEYHRMECSSDRTESWHSWSNNSRWIVFSSKRDTGLFVRPYICYIDANGKEHKPFLLPQKDPAFYDTWLMTYNLPELVSGPITVTTEELLSVLSQKQEEGATSKSPWQQSGEYLH